MNLLATGVGVASFAAVGLVLAAAQGVDHPVRGGAVASVAAPVRTIDPRPSACGQCHEAAVAQWRGSMHAHAWNNPVFRAEYDAAPAASCRGCHDPSATATGVDCATCHVRDGAVVAVRRTARGQAAHPIVVDAMLTEVSACASCHQFNFTDDGIHDPTELLQSTVQEWRTQSAANSATCQDCHMEREFSAVDHRFAGLHDAELLRSAVDIEVLARRTSAGVDVEVTVAAANVGHAVPTGDVFRRGVLTVQTDDGAQEQLVMQRWLARTTDHDGEGSHVRTVDDTRVPPPGQGVVQEHFGFAGSKSGSVSWSFQIHRLPLERAQTRGLSRETVVVAVDAGVVPVTGATAG